MCACVGLTDVGKGEEDTDFYADDDGVLDAMFMDEVLDEWDAH